ncbi:MAG: hypothetical protein ACRBCK_09130 [Alphaproteobacteria bacterium]
MKFLQKINWQLSSLLKNRFFETDKPETIHEHFFAKGNRQAAFLHPSKEQLDEVYQSFSDLQEKLDPEHADNFELTAEFENGRLIDLYTAYKGSEGYENSQHHVITHEDARPLMDAFLNITKPCVSEDFALKVFGKNLTGIPNWHYDGSEEVVGVLTLKDHDLTTLFQGALGSLPAPKHAVVFTGNEKHKVPDIPRASMHIIDHS